MLFNPSPLASFIVLILKIVQVIQNKIYAFNYNWWYLRIVKISKIIYD
jgi:hypothetical protein